MPDIVIKLMKYRYRQLIFISTTLNKFLNSQILISILYPT